ncbi:pyridoxamine 5'-phosphate oxidase family protein [Dactylosporangium fulvum]|uniref:Pyridoxamine 5'-phosphate oxidase family protein n=1 Tax=Dactylosporangium fulvum TaxID=53359 RepID=A0ABY5VRI2_9ACTN|nr:pyridoxamine 5'-phosphate oxidase family protein [Dactylosporangium fulvum]UWP79411.1 pyridoxamine 5'-phosphate oxidase family protein [Dactylosporangium fulvum]
MPDTALDQRYSDDHATAVPWEVTQEELATAGVYWLSTVRPDGRPHVTPLIGVWLDDALLFCTGSQERKARNLAANPEVAVTTGANALHAGLDVVVEGPAVVLRDEPSLTRAAAAWLAKYGEEWRFEVRDGRFHHASGAGVADVYRVAPAAVFAFGKDPYSQTRYAF